MKNNSTQSQNQRKDDIVFNVVLLKNSSTLSFLLDIVTKDTYKWAMIRDLFKGKKNVRLSLVDRCAETPFQCLLLAKFCKQLEEELEFTYGTMKLELSNLKRECPGTRVIADGKFDTTANRNKFLSDCMEKIVGRPANITSKRHLVRSRDIKFSTDEFTLIIRVHEGITRGWQIADNYTAAMSADDILNLHEHDIPCRNWFIHSNDKSGIWIGIELQPNNNHRD